MKSPRFLQHVLLAGALTAGIAACGSSSPSSGASSPPATTAPATTAPATTAAPATSAPASSSAAAAATIKANWEAFFSAKTPVAKRIDLLQDGSVFASIIKGQASSSLASSASAKVTKVTVESATQAKVTYDILVAGESALSGQNGVAVYSGGVWKVGIASFCGLLTVENGGSTAKLPATCKSAG